MCKTLRALLSLTADHLQNYPTPCHHQWSQEVVTSLSQCQPLQSPTKCSTPSVRMRWSHIPTGCGKPVPQNLQWTQYRARTGQSCGFSCRSSLRLDWCHKAPWRSMPSEETVMTFRWQAQLQHFPMPHPRPPVAFTQTHPVLPPVTIRKYLQLVLWAIVSTWVSTRDMSSYKKFTSLLMVWGSLLSHFLNQEHMHESCVLTMAWSVWQVVLLSLRIWPETCETSTALSTTIHTAKMGNLFTQRKPELLARFEPMSSDTGGEEGT